MFKFQDKVLFEYWSFVDEPYISFSLVFKFVEGYVIDNEKALRVLVQDVELVDGNSEVINPNMSPVWRHEKAFPVNV